jgi:hypothetical protein
MDNDFICDDKLQRIRNKNRKNKNKNRDKMKNMRREEKRFGKSR